MENKVFDVVVVGELNIDLVLWQVPMPEYETEKLAEDMRFTMGSSSAITAHNLSVIGAKVGFVGKAGKDIFGDFMIQQLQLAGVDTSHIIQDASLKTGATIVLANPPQKALLTYLGAMTELRLEDLDWDFLSRARHLHLGCYYLQTGLMPEVPRLFARAKELGLTTSLDTNWDPREVWSEDLYEVLQYTDIFLPNNDEAIRIAHVSDLESAVEKLGRMVKILAVKRGARGALVAWDGKKKEIPPFRVETIETTGAGDSFNAGFLFKFLEGEAVPECARFGNACGALAVTALGGTGAFPDTVTVRQALQQILQGD